MPDEFSPPSDDVGAAGAAGVACPVEGDASPTPKKLPIDEEEEEGAGEACIALSGSSDHKYCNAACRVALGRNSGFSNAIFNFHEITTSVNLLWLAVYIARTSDTFFNRLYWVLPQHLHLTR
jgi:hypothetical protein